MDSEEYTQSSDPYAIIWVGSEEDMETPSFSTSSLNLLKSTQVVKSPTIFDSLNPEWNFHFLIDGGEKGFNESDVLHLRLFDYDANSAHDYMGKNE
jgi:hypothetical protein